MKAEEFLREADPYGGSLISPYDDEPSEDELDSAFDYMQEYVKDYLHTNPGKLFLKDLSDTSLDLKDKRFLMHDLFRDAIRFIRNNLEKDNIDFFTDKDIKHEIVKYLS